MAKKITYTFNASLNLNSENGGGWLAVLNIVDEDGNVQSTFCSAWKNASAGKRYFKKMVQELTPRKSIKMIAGEDKDAKGKPASFTGELKYKA